MQLVARRDASRLAVTYAGVVNDRIEAAAFVDARGNLTRLRDARKIAKDDTARTRHRRHRLHRMRTRLYPRTRIYFDRGSKDVHLLTSTLSEVLETYPRSTSHAEVRDAFEPVTEPRAHAARTRNAGQMPAATALSASNRSWTTSTSSRSAGSLSQRLKAL